MNTYNTDDETTADTYYVKGLDGDLVTAVHGMFGFEIFDSYFEPHFD